VGYTPRYHSKGISVLMILTDDFGFLEEKRSPDEKKREVDIESYPCMFYYCGKKISFD
jgi:hypothetical protein